MAMKPSVSREFWRFGRRANSLRRAISAKSFAFSSDRDRWPQCRGIQCANPGAPDSLVTASSPVQLPRLWGRHCIALSTLCLPKFP